MYFLTVFDSFVGYCMINMYNEVFGNRLMNKCMKQSTAGARLTGALEMEKF